MHRAPPRPAPPRVRAGARLRASGWLPLGQRAAGESPCVGRSPGSGSGSGLQAALCVAAARCRLRAGLGMAGPFVLEIRRGTRSASLLVREASLRSLPADISLAPARLELRSAGACGALELPPGLSLAPASCRGLRSLPGGALHLCLRLREAPGGAELVYNLRESLKPQKNCIFYCQSCGDVIVKERKFLRVLPLPSENWSALVEEWCCHPNPFAKSTLHPQRDDCFLGDTFFLLNSENESHVPEPPICCSETGHHASQNGSTLKSKENTRVFCKRCKTMLGETVSSDTIKYYVTEVIVQPSEGSFSTIPRSQFVQSMVAQCLMELSSAKSTFRFTIKGDDGKIYILIWLLNSDTLLVESLGSPSSHNVFTLFGDTLLPNSGAVGTWSAVKVLYQPCVKSRNKERAAVGLCDSFSSAPCLQQDSMDNHLAAFAALTSATKS
ncbi:E3 ubiquitin-protein ligase E3D [Aix galericulata]|nr:E3 ubiquitin-protein ligase E3D [Aix galericulata]